LYASLLFLEGVNNLTAEPKVLLLSKNDLDGGNVGS
jgi:hypothetical protein